jgi:hypothetical protein
MVGAADVAGGEGEEGGPVGGRSVAGAVLAESDVAVDEWSFDGRELGGADDGELAAFDGADGLFAEEFVDGAGGYCGEEGAFGVDPAVALGGAAADEDGARSAEGDKFVGVDGEVFGIERAVVLDEIAREPVVFAGASEIAHLLAEIAAVEFGAACSGRADVGDGETRVVGHGDQRGFAVARVAGDSDLPGIYRFIRFKIVEAATGSPCPGAERAPIVELARLAFVDEADNSFLEAIAFVGLDARGDVDGVAPALGEDLLLPGGRGGGLLGHFGVEFGDTLHDFFAEGEFQHHGDGTGGFGGRGDGEFDVDGNGGICGVVDVADEMFCDDGDVAVGFVGGVDEFPGHFGDVCGDAAVNFTVEVFEDFSAAFVLPVLGGFDGFSILEDQRIGQRGVGAGFGFVVVGEVVGGVRGAVGGGADFGDVEGVYEALVVLVGGEVGRGRWRLWREIGGIRPRMGVIWLTRRGMLVKSGGRVLASAGPSRFVLTRRRKVTG